MMAITNYIYCFRVHENSGFPPPDPNEQQKLFLIDGERIIFRSLARISAIRTVHKPAFDPGTISAMTCLFTKGIHGISTWHDFDGNSALLTVAKGAAIFREETGTSYRFVNVCLERLCKLEADDEPS